MGTNVVSGTAIAVIIATGGDTYFGSVAKGLVGKHAETSFEKGINSVGWLLIRFIAVMVPVVFFINGFTKRGLASGIPLCPLCCRRLDTRDASDDCYR